MNEELFKDLIRPVREEDREKLPVFSYSKMEVYKNCPYQYDLKYNQKKYDDSTSIALEIGSLLHYVLEQKGKMIASTVNSLPIIDYEKLNKIILYGTKETDEKTKEVLLGVEELKKKYWETWSEPDNKSGMNYSQKLEIFDKVLHTEMEDDDWKPVYFELPFEFVYRDKVIIKGFIDRIDMRDGEYRTVDYKTSKATYEQSKLATSLQFGVYALAILNEFGKLPIESMYRFILIDEKQYALTRGYEKRLIKALDGIFDKIEADEKNKIWIPKSSPLCHWCSYCSHNPDATNYKYECEYYSLWEPNNKTFAVNKQFNPDDLNSSKSDDINGETKRKLVF